MADESTVTEISTPAETPVEDTSTNVEPDNTGTSTVEPETGDAAAGTETKTQETRLYADKYKSVEDLEKGYKELQGVYTKASDFEQKYNDLLAQQQANAQRIEQQNLNEARSKGFQSPQEQRIAESVQVAEFEQYVNNLNSINPEYLEAVRHNLLQYYQTAHPAYLEEAKRYFPPSIIENVTLAKNSLQHRLISEYQAQQAQIADQNTRNLAEALKTEFPDFLNELKNNEGRAQALQQFCNAGFINSKEDMQAFINVVSKIEATAKEQAIAEYEAQKAIEKTKKAAQISSNTFIPENKEKYSEEDLAKMPQAQFDKIYAQKGLAAFI